MRYLSLFSGIEAASVAWEPLGWTPVGFSEIEAFPSAVLAARYPSVPNLGDVVQLRDRLKAGEDVAGLLSHPPDIVVGGSPCFTQGHLVLTEHGYRPIEDLRPGDRVVTHTGRLCPIVRVGSKMAPVGRLDAVGRPMGVRVTPDHPFLAVDFRKRSTRVGGQSATVEECGPLEWVPAADLPGNQWTSLTEAQVDLPEMPTDRFTEREILYLIGAYLGDGHLRKYAGRFECRLVFSLNAEKVERFRREVPQEKWCSFTQERTCLRITVCDSRLAHFIWDHFGEFSHAKRIPAWVLAHPGREHLLRGYLDTDGFTVRGGHLRINSVSPALAFGVADLAQTCGYVASVGHVKVAPQKRIEGRLIHQRDWYSVNLFLPEKTRSSRKRHGYLLRKVTDYRLEDEKARVYNIEVADDHSYIVQGMIVHNCQAFSIAGARQGLSCDRGNLTLVYAEIIHVLRPKFVLWENVPGVLSMRDNAFGHLLGALAGEDGPLEPSGRKWSNAGAVLGPERAIAWRILDAQYFGVAQQRRRVFLVGSRRDGPVPHPWEILFEFEGLRRDTAPRRPAREAVAGTLASRTGGGGFPGTDESCGGYLQPVCGVTGEVAHTLRCEGFDASEDGTGRGTPIVSAFGGRTDGERAVSTTLSTKQQRLDFDTETFLVAAFAENTRGEIRFEDGDGGRTGTLSTGGGKPGQGRPCVLQVDVPDCAGTLKACAKSGGWSNSVDHAAAGYMLPVAFNARQDPIVTGDRTGALSSTLPQAESVLESLPTEPMEARSVALRGRKVGADLEMRSDGVASALRASQGGSDKAMVAWRYGVRRLMPYECARLQGFPDDYLDIVYRGKPAADGPKYKALGNSMAVPVMRWIGERLQKKVGASMENGSTCKDAEDDL